MRKKTHASGETIRKGEVRTTSTGATKRGRTIIKQKGGKKKDTKTETGQCNAHKKRGRFFVRRAKKEEKESGKKLIQTWLESAERRVESSQGHHGKPIGNRHN